MKHKGTQKIETERLILRKFRVSDAQMMFNNWASDSEVTKYLTWPPHENIDFSQKLLSEWVSHYKNNTYYQWCIELKENSQAIGSIAAVGFIEETESARIGYCLSKAHWGKGLMTEALSAVISFFFNKVGINRIQAEHDVNNPASGRVMEKCGLKYEGTLIQAARNQQGLIDICIHGLVQRDYKTNLLVK